MFKILTNAVARLAIQPTKQIFFNPCSAFYHLLSKSNQTGCNSSLVSAVDQQLLRPTQVTLVPSCGFKVKGRLKRRCKDCYFVVRDDRMFVICKTHPRHKQMAMVKKEKNTWILTHATMGKVRPW